MGFNLRSGNNASPMKVCGPGDTKCGLNNKKVDKPGTVVSRSLDKVGDFFTNITKNKKKKKEQKYQKKGSYGNPRYLSKGHPIPKGMG